MSSQVELKYGSPKHKTVLEMIRSRKIASKRKMRDYHQKWDEADDGMRAYIPASEKDQVRKAKKSQGTYDYVTITVPYSYAIIMTAHTYWTTVFLSRDPVYQLQGRHGEAQNSVEAFEAALAYQLVVGKHLVPLYNWLYDMTKYGLGIVGTYWERNESIISRLVEQPMMMGRVPIIGKTQKVMQSQSVLKYEGNCVYNVRPYDFYPDPRVALTNFQAGEFCGRDTQVGWHEILDGQREGRYFNVDILAQKSATSAQGTYDSIDQGSQRLQLPDQANTEDALAIPGPGFVQLHEMTIRVLPRALGLGPSDRVEKWLFTVANGDVIIGAQPLGLYHDEFPFDLMEYGMGAHEFLKINLMEIMQPLVDSLSWLFNSHFYNVRKALNDVRIVDPSRVVMKDLTGNPLEQGIIRLKPELYGTDVRTAIMQLQVADMTQNHMRDAAVIEQLIQRVTGVVDELMGLSTGPDRESATGVRTRTGFAANRLKTIAEYNSALGMTPLIAKQVSNTQQFMTTEQKFRIAGADGMRFARSFVAVNPALIAGQYDYVPVDGTLPVDRLAQANFWKELIIQLATTPYAQAWNINEMIAYTMRLQGQKNVDRFRINLQDPNAVAQAVQAGDLIPLPQEEPSGPKQQASGSSGATL